MEFVDHIKKGNSADNAQNHRNKDYVNASVHINAELLCVFVHKQKRQKKSDGDYYGIPVN